MPKPKDDGSRMHGIKWTLDCHDKPIQIMPLSDLHVGDPHSNMDLIKSNIARIQADENMYCILAGDLMNTAIVGSKSDSYGETMRPSEQLETCYDLFAPIVNKILCITPGNHEARITRTAGTDMTRLFARELGLQDIYCPDAGLVFVKFGKSEHSEPLVYSIYINHGHGGGRKVGGKLNGLQDFASIIDSDIFVVGHTHLPASFKQSSYRVHPGKSEAILHEQLFVNTAASLTYGGYGKANGYQPPSNSYPIITLDNRAHHMSVTL